MALIGYMDTLVRPLMKQASRQGRHRAACRVRNCLARLAVANPDAAKRCILVWAECTARKNQNQGDVLPDPLTTVCEAIAMEVACCEGAEHGPSCEACTAFAVTQPPAA
jgi:hypothetical protein